MKARALLDAMNRQARKQAYLSKLKRGSETGNCTQLAREDQERFGGTVVGYWLEDNPTAMDLPEDGHDFLLTPDGFILDRWMSDAWDPDLSPVLDRKDPADAAEIKRRYGDPGTWQVM